MDCFEMFKHVLLEEDSVGSATVLDCRPPPMGKQYRSFLPSVHGSVTIPSQAVDPTS